MSGIPAIGINIHTPGTKATEDVGIDILYGKRIDLDMLEHIPDIKDNPQAMEVVTELVAKLPDMEIDGNMSEEMEEQNYNMLDNVQGTGNSSFNNGAGEMAQKEENKKEQE